jgi:hypothetical protein
MPAGLTDNFHNIKKNVLTLTQAGLRESPLESSTNHITYVANKYSGSFGTASVPAYGSNTSTLQLP